MDDAQNVQNPQQDPNNTPQATPIEENIMPKPEATTQVEEAAPEGAPQAQA